MGPVPLSSCKAISNLLNLYRALDTLLFVIACVVIIVEISLQSVVRISGKFMSNLTKFVSSGASYMKIGF